MAKILIVDDSPTEKLNFRRMLEKHGHDVVSADSGDMGVKMAASEHPDIILMDVVMPGTNGFQATRQLTRNQATKHIPVIIVTTKDQETDRVWAERQGARGYLTKPVAEKSLVQAINEALVSRSRR